MNWQAISAVSEIVGAVAVVISLIYVAAQIRQNTLQTRSDGHARVTDSYNDLLGQLLADDALFKLIVVGCQEWSRLSPFEQSRFHIFFHQHLMHLRMAYQLHDKGAMDDDVYKTVEDLHINVLANPGAKVWWKMVGESLVEVPLKNLINGKLEERKGQSQATTEAWEFYDPKNWAD
jgi:hypothetical protein